MDGDLLGTRRLGVVRDDFDKHQVSDTGLVDFFVDAASRTACTWTA